ncbi:TolC family outer membrane protein [Parvibaculum sp.]|uniref:TolC family outer membrane protein n=1 Tax=Parvibaculum sp. TaxID=2024848 RepID=UPI00320ECABA
MKRSLGASVKLMALGGASALALTVMAPFASAENLVDALSAAYQSNPDLQSQRAQQRATDEQVPQALAGWRPTVTAQGTYAATRSRANLKAPAGASLDANSRPLTGSVTLSENLFAGGRTVNSTAQAEHVVEAGQNSLLSAEQATLLNAVAAYMNVIRDQGVVDLNKNNVEVLKRQLEQTQDRFRVGELTRTDVAQSEARLSGAKTGLRQAEAQLTASRASYEKIVGHGPADLVKPAAVANLPQSEDQARAYAERNNPDLKAARASEAASRAAVSVAKGALLPTFDVQAQYQYARDPSSSALSSATVRTSDESSIMGVLTIPLYQSGAEYSKVRAAKEQASAALMQIASVQRLVDEAVRDAWEQLLAARSNIVSSQEQVKANEIALEGVKQEEQVGSQTTLDVLNAEQELLNARVTLVSAERDEVVASYNLLAATGQLTARQLQLPVKYYDPQVNADEVRDKWIGFGTAGDDGQ